MNSSKVILQKNTEIEIERPANLEKLRQITKE